MLSIGKPYDDMDLREFSKLQVGPFLSRVIIFLVLCVAFSALAVLTSGILAFLGMVLLGLVYAHGVELQHQALHNAAFPSKWWNRFVGFFLGLPMLVSFSDYQHSHLRHHRLLGTKDDREFFNYGYEHLTSLKPLLLHLLMVRHYRDVSVFIVKALLGKTKPDIKQDQAERIRTEYQLMGVAIALSVAASIYFETFALVKLWFIPLLFAIPAHALIELPEHWGEDHDTVDVRENTRTIRAGWFGTWYTNGNNYHIEHHWLPSIPNHRFPQIHARIKDEIQPDPGYWPFYKRFLGELYRNTFKGGSINPAPQS